MARWIDRTTGFAAAAGFAGYALLGLSESALLRLRYPFWFPSLLGWAWESARNALWYGAIGAVWIAFLSLLAGAWIRSRAKTADADRSIRRFAIGSSVFFLLFILAGYWLKRFFLPALREPVTLGVLGAIGAVALASALVAARALPLARPGGRARELLLAPVALGLAFLLAGAVVDAGHRGGQGKRPNIVLVTIDTLRGDHLSAYGYPRDTAPAFDRVAKSGAIFLSAVATTPFTQPSTASILTGLYPHRHGVRNHPNLLVEDRLTLAEVLEANGYATAAFSSQGLLVPEWGFAQGFRLFERVGAPARFDITFLGRVLERLGLRPIDRNWRSDAVSDRGIGWLDRRPRRPFFLWLHYLDPHFPYEPAPGYERMFDSGSPVAALTDLHAPDGRRRLFNLDLSEDQMRRNIDLYDCEIRFTDDMIGRLIAKLEEMGVFGETIVVITADHGENLGEQGLYFAHTHFLYDPSLLVPLAVSYPEKIRPGTRISRVMSDLDIMPTVLDLAGIEVPAGLEGRSLAPLLLGGEKGEPRAVFGENGRTIVGNLEEPNPRWTVEGDAGRWRMVRTDEYKLIRIPEPDAVRYELYDLRVDPGETHDIAAEEPAVVDSLTKALLAWSEEESATSTFKKEIDDETMRSLRELGYIQ
jgi:arylsulfatase A-like enzyme